MMRSSESAGGLQDAKLASTDQTSGQCFYGLCDKVSCCGFLPCGRFKDRKHALYCNLFTAMVTCLFLAVIGPLVSLSACVGHCRIS